MIGSLDFQEFFSKEKSYVLICFNEQTIMDTFGVPKEETYKFMYFWHFISHDKATGKYTLQKFASNPEFKSGDQVVDVVKAHQILRRLHDLWKEQFAIPFPDVIIRGLKGSGSYAPGEPGQVILTVEELLDLDRMEFVFSHELGHYFYNQNIQKEALEKVEKLSYWKQNSSAYISWGVLVYNFSISLYYMFQPVEALGYIPRILFIALNFLVMGYIGYFEFASFLSWKKRQKNYTQEFYADHFAQKFLGIKVKQGQERFVGDLFSFNVYTHPRSDWRLKSLEINEQSTYFQWYNPVAEKPKLFTRSSFFEVIEFWKIQGRRIKSALKRPFKRFF